MGRIQEGGVHTQKVSLAIGSVALLIIGAFLCCPFSAVAAEESVYVVNVEGEADFCGVNTSLTASDAIKVTYTISGDASYNYEADLLNSDDESSGKITNQTGQLTGVSLYSKTITVTAPLESGNYRLVVSFYAVEDTDRKEEVIAEKTVPLKVVDPIVLKFSLKNDGSNDVILNAYFKINGEKDEKSVQTVTIKANDTTDVTYNYYVKDVEDTKYSLETDDQIVKGSITGLGEEKTFYAHDSDYSVITTIVVVVLVIMAIILFFVLRKPVVNKGKPKGRR